MILTDLDSIFDTRLATWERLIPIKDLEQMVMDGYFQRCYDRPRVGDYDEFLLGYQQRDKATLSLAKATGILGPIREFLRADKETGIQNPMAELAATELLVNTHPYDLDDDEDSLLLNMISTNLELPGVKVTLINMELSDITPHWLIRKRVDAMVMYDADAWVLSCYERDQYATVCPSIILYGPRLIFTELTEEDAIDPNRSPEQRWENQKTIYSPLVDLELLSPSLFSADYLSVIYTDPSQ